MEFEMKYKKWLSKKFTLVGSLLLFCSYSWSAGLLTPVDQQYETLKIKSHHVSVVIEDGYAMTEITQTFFNPHDKDLEANYVFPVPDQAAVSEFVVWIDGKPVVGEVLAKKQAETIYQEEKAAGREAGITEKNDYKTFNIRVSPVKSNQETKIKLVYYQSAFVDSGIGRYVYPLEDGGVNDKNKFWQTHYADVEDFQFELVLASSAPVNHLRIPDYPDAIIQHNDAGIWQATIQNKQPQNNEAEDQVFHTVNKLNKDIVIYWRHQEGLPGSVDFIAHKPDHDKQGTFMMVFTPGDDLELIEEGKDWLFVLDISGSMTGKYTTLIEGVTQALGKMRTQDRFRIIVFNNESREITPEFVYATPENIRFYSDEILKISPHNGTNLFAGLKQAMTLINQDRTSAIILVTDGVANVGNLEKKSFLKLVEQNDVRLFTFVMGNSANKPLLKSLAKTSGGFSMQVSNSDDIVGRILLATSKVTHEAFHHAKLTIAGIRVNNLTPDTIGSLYQGQQLVVLGRYWNGGVAEIKLTGKKSGQDKVYQTEFTFPDMATDNPEIERIWAYARIQDLKNKMQQWGDNQDDKVAIKDLAIQYGLVTDDTSMVVIRDEIFVERGIERRNLQRVNDEHHAQQQRSSRPVVSKRADQHKPMYTKARPSIIRGGGGGSVSGSLLLVLMLLSLVVLRQRIGKFSAID